MFQQYFYDYSLTFRYFSVIFRESQQVCWWSRWNTTPGFTDLSTSSNSSYSWPVQLFWRARGCFSCLTEEQNRTYVHTSFDFNFHLKHLKCLDAINDCALWILNKAQQFRWGVRKIILIHEHISIWSRPWCPFHKKIPHSSFDMFRIFNFVGPVYHACAGLGSIVPVVCSLLR